MIPHVATCIAIGTRAVLLEGTPGSGKSTLALALIDRGAQLIGDDGIMLEVDAGRLIAHPHPRTAGLLEIRNLGIVSFPVCTATAIALVIMLDEAAPRFVEGASTIERAGVCLPGLQVWPGSAALKVEHALRLYGLPA